MKPEGGSVASYLWKVSEDGTTVWAVQCSGGGFDTTKLSLNDLAADGSGNFIAAGTMNSAPSPVFGGLKIPPGGETDGVLFKVNGDGTTLWAVPGGGAGAGSKDTEILILRDDLSGRCHGDFASGACGDASASPTSAYRIGKRGSQLAEVGRCKLDPNLKAPGFKGST